MPKTRLLGTLVAAVSLLAFPVAADAGHGSSHGKAKGKGKSKGSAKRCAKTPKVGFTVAGTLVSIVEDDATTPENEGTVTITVTNANSHARKSGELTDQDPNAEGTQVAGGTYTVPTSDAYTLEKVGYEGDDTMSPGDLVNISGKVERTKSKCAPSGTSTADRYGDVNVRKVTVTDNDPDTV